MKRRTLGQHYLVDDDVVRRMVSAASILPGERVLEIGTGRGAITRHLAGLGAGLEAYEIDPANLVETRKAVSGLDVRLHLGDAFKAAPRFDVLVASLPYSRSAEFVEWLSQTKFDRAVVLLQRDFVDKLQSPPGGRDYRAISVISQAAFDVKVLLKVGRQAFEPRPKVGSVVISLTAKKPLPKEQIAFMKELFSLRRKEVKAALRLLHLEASQDYGHRRVVTLTPPEVMELYAEAAA